MAQEWRDRLQAESERWVRDGVITAEQRGAILKLYPADSANGRDRAVMIFSILGSLLVGAGVILYLASNWPLIPAAAKVATIMAAIVAAYGAGYYFQFVRADFPRLGQGLILLGALFYGAGIVLVAQIYHFQNDFPGGFLLWGAGLLPLVWAVGSRPVLYLATGGLVLWTIGVQGPLSQFNYLLPVLMLAAVLPLARRNQSWLVEGAVLLSLFLWHGINAGRTANHVETVVIGRAGLLYGSALFLYGLARLGDLRLYLGTGSFITLLGAYLLTFEGPGWVNPRPAVPSLIGGAPYHLVAGLVLLALVAAGAVLLWRQRGAGAAWELQLALVPTVAAIAVQFLPEGVRMVAFNLLLFVMTLGLVMLGIQRRLELLVNLGLLAFLAHLITRYFDLFYSALDRSLFFILGGVLLLAGGWFLERNRRRWVGEWGGDQNGA